MRLAHAEIDAALAAGRTPIVVGGTGLYLRAALAQLSLRQGAAGDRGVGAVVARDPPPDTASSASTWTAGSSTSGSTRGPRRSSPAGRAEEVRRAEAAGPSRTARKALGFEELLGGDVERMKKRSRNYARRQLTWMRKMADLQTIDRTGRAATPRWPPRSSLCSFGQ